MRHRVVLGYVSPRTRAAGVRAFNANLCVSYDTRSTGVDMICFRRKVSSKTNASNTYKLVIACEQSSVSVIEFYVFNC